MLPRVSEERQHLVKLLQRPGSNAEGRSARNEEAQRALRESLLDK